MGELPELSDLRNFMPSDFEKGNKVGFQAQNTLQHNSKKFFSRNFVAQITSHTPNNK